MIIESAEKIQEILNLLLTEYEALTKEKKKNTLLERFCLTQREKEIYNYLELGFSRTQIAKELNLSVATVKNQISSLCKKISAPNTKMAVQKIKELAK
ncbi:MAG: helix-turn-helix transcriptional regulator [Bacteroidota bacterium]